MTKTTSPDPYARKDAIRTLLAGDTALLDTIREKTAAYQAEIKALLGDLSPLTAQAQAVQFAQQATLGAQHHLDALASAVRIGAETGEFAPPARPDLAAQRAAARPVGGAA